GGAAEKVEPAAGELPVHVDPFRGQRLADDARAAERDLRADPIALRLELDGHQPAEHLGLGVEFRADDDRVPAASPAAVPPQQGDEPHEGHRRPPHPRYGTPIDVWHFLVDNRPELWSETAAHPRLAALAVGTAGVIFTIPSLALYALLVAPLGLGTAPAVAALALYSVLPV